jgi:hypothetical protein
MQHGNPVLLTRRSWRQTQHYWIFATQCFPKVSILVLAVALEKLDLVAAMAVNTPSLMLPPNVL